MSSDELEMILTITGGEETVGASIVGADKAVLARTMIRRIEDWAEPEAAASNKALLLEAAEAIVHTTAERDDAIRLLRGCLKILGGLDDAFPVEGEARTFVRRFRGVGE